MVYSVFVVRVKAAPGGEVEAVGADAHQCNFEQGVQVVVVEFENQHLDKRNEASLVALL